MRNPHALILSPFLFHSKNPEAGHIEDKSLEAIFSEDDNDVAGDDSESDGYLSEVVNIL